MASVRLGALGVPGVPLTLIPLLTSIPPQHCHWHRRHRNATSQEGRRFSARAFVAGARLAPVFLAPATRLPLQPALTGVSTRPADALPAPFRAASGLVLRVLLC